MAEVPNKDEKKTMISASCKVTDNNCSGMSGEMIILTIDNYIIYLPQVTFENCCQKL